MAWSFNPFTGNLDLVGSGGGTVVFEGEVETFADLPETIGDPAVGASFLVRSSTGVWLVNRRQAGIWIRRNNTGVRATDWEYGGDYPVNSVNGQTGNVSLTASSVGAQGIFSYENLTITGNTTLTAARAKIYDVSAFSGTPYNLTLPTTGNQVGDIVALRVGFISGSSVVTVKNDTTTVGSLGDYAFRRYRFVNETGTASGWRSDIVPIHVQNLQDPDAISGVLPVGNLPVGTTSSHVAAGDHVHGNLTNDGKVGSTAGLPVVTTTSGAITTLALGAANQVLKVNSGGTAVEFGEGGGIDDYTVIASSQTATNGARIAANTTAGAFTLTLPASPSNGDTVSILDYAGTFNTNNLTIARNGSNIESLAENMDCNIRNAAFSLVFVGATIGWKVVPYFGSSVNFSSPNAIGNSVPNTGAFTTLTANSLTSGLLSATPAANASGITSTGYSLTGSNAQSLVDLSGTWNTTGTPTAFRLNVTNTASNAASLLMDLQTGGTTQFSVRRDGVINASNYYRFTGLNSGLFVHSAGGGVISIGDSPNNWMTLTSTRMQLTGDLSLGRALSAGQSADTILARDAANTVAQINGTNAQTFRLYNTFTSTTNFERLNIIAQSAASVIIGTEKGSGGGSARGLELRTDNVARINISATGGIGFFGAAAAAQPTAVADATDAATVITQLNALLSRMRTLGLIAT